MSFLILPLNDSPCKRNRQLSGYNPHLCPLRGGEGVFNSPRSLPPFGDKGEGLGVRAKRLPEAKAIRLKKPSALKRTEPPMSLLKQAWSSQPDGFSLGRLMGDLPHD